MSSHILIHAQDPNFSLLFHLATPSFRPLLLPHPYPQEQGKCRYFSHTHTQSKVIAAVPVAAVAAVATSLTQAIFVFRMQRK